MVKSASSGLSFPWTVRDSCSFVTERLCTPSLFWSGALTLHEVEGRRILKDVATQKRNGAVFTGEFNLKQ